MVRAARRHALSRGMSMLVASTSKNVWATSRSRAAFETEGGVDRACSAPRARARPDRQHDRRTAHARSRPHRPSATRCCSTRARVSTCRHTAAASATSSRKARLFPHLNVATNLDYGRWMCGKARDAAATARVVELLGIGHILDRRPGGLSGGETPAGGDRARAAHGAAAAAARRAAGVARRGAQARNPSLSRPPARRGQSPDDLCQPPCAGSEAHRDLGRAAGGRARRRDRRPRGARRRDGGVRWA